MNYICKNCDKIVSKIYSDENRKNWFCYQCHIDISLKPVYVRYNDEKNKKLKHKRIYGKRALLYKDLSDI